MNNNNDLNPGNALYSLVDIDKEPSLSDLRLVKDYWLKLKGDRLAPSWRDVDLMELPSSIVPRVCVLDVIPEGPDFCYRYWGTAITTLHHYDLTGKSVLTLTPAHYGQCIWQQYAEVLKTKAPISFLTKIPLDEVRQYYYASVRMPLSSNGQDIDMIITAEDYGQDREQLAKIFLKVWRNQDNGVD